jgi:hypothetical protein
MNRKKNVVYVYTMEYYSVIKKNEIMLFTGKRMELEVKQNQPVWEKASITRSLSYVESRLFF